MNDVSTAEWDPDHRLTLGERLRAPGVRAWYIGGSAGLVWQAILVVTVFFLDVSVIRKVAGLVLLAVLYGGFMVLGPLVWREPTRVKLLAITGYWGLSFLLFPLKFSHVHRWVFAGGKHSVHHGRKERRAAHVKGVLHRRRNDALRSSIGNVKQVGEQPWQASGDN